MTAQLSHRVVLVTGAASGIGLATAEAFANEGAELALADINREKLEAEAARLTKAHGQPVRALCQHLFLLRGRPSARLHPGSHFPAAAEREDHGRLRGAVDRDDRQDAPDVRRCCHHADSSAHAGARAGGRDRDAPSDPHHRQSRRPRVHADHQGAFPRLVRRRLPVPAGPGGCRTRGRRRHGHLWKKSSRPTGGGARGSRRRDNGCRDQTVLGPGTHDRGRRAGRKSLRLHGFPRGSRPCGRERGHQGPWRWLASTVSSWRPCGSPT